MWSIFTFVFTFWLCTRGITAENCGVFTDSANITSRGFPGSYPPNHDCTWTIDVPSDDRVTIKLDKFDVEPSMTCEFDYMEVTAKGYYKKFCGFKKDQPRLNEVLQTRGKTTIRFRTDGNEQYSGFVLNVDVSLTNNKGMSNISNTETTNSMSANKSMGMSSNQKSHPLAVMKNMMFGKLSKIHNNNLTSGNNTDRKGKLISLKNKENEPCKEARKQEVNKNCKKNSNNTMFKLPKRPEAMAAGLTVGVLLSGLGLILYLMNSK